MRALFTDASSRAIDIDPMLPLVTVVTATGTRGTVLFASLGCAVGLATAGALQKQIARDYNADDDKPPNPWRSPAGWRSGQDESQIRIVRGWKFGMGVHQSTQRHHPEKVPRERSGR